MLELEYDNDRDILILLFNKDNKDLDPTISREIAGGVIFTFDYNYKPISMELPNISKQLGVQILDPILESYRLSGTDIFLGVKMYNRVFNIKIDCSKL